MVAVKSRWSPKLPGLADVVKNNAFSGIKCVPFILIFDLLLYSDIKPKLALLSMNIIYHFTEEEIPW